MVFFKSVEFELAREDKDQQPFIQWREFPALEMAANGSARTRPSLTSSVQVTGTSRTDEPVSFRIEKHYRKMEGL